MTNENKTDKGVNITVSTAAHEIFTDEARETGRKRGKKMSLRELMDKKASI